MTNTQFIQQSKYFSINESWGNLEKINPLLLHFLLDLRKTLNYPINIHCAYQTTGHTANSQHYKGNAVDFDMRKCQPFTDCIAKVLAWAHKEIVVAGVIYVPDNYCGIGVYPHWNSRGFHLDVRGTKARWAYDKAGTQISIEEGIRQAKELE